MKWDNSAEYNVPQLSEVDKVPFSTVQHFRGPHFIKWDVCGDSFIIIIYSREL